MIKVFVLQLFKSPAHNDTTKQKEVTIQD